MTDKKILIVDDNIALCDNLEDILREQGYETHCAHSCGDGLRRAIELRPQVALLDLKLPDGLGTELMAELKKIDPDCICIIATAFADVESAIRALELGAFNYLHKPVRPDELMLILERAFEMIVLRNSSRRTTARLLESEEIYRTLVDNIPLGISLIDRDYRIIMTNKTHAEMIGQPQAWFIGRHCYEVFENRQETCPHCPGTESMATAALSRAYSTAVRQDGSRIDVHIHSVPLMGDNMEPYGFIEVVEDITERKRAEESLERTRMGLRQIIDLIPEMLWLKDADGRFLMVNQANARNYNMSVEALTGKLHSEIHADKDEVTRMLLDDRRVIETNMPVFIPEESFLGADGLTRYLQTTKIPFDFAETGEMAILGIALDITERKNSEDERLNLERQLLHAQKLESLGVLAGGIAHDFNNILTAIIGNAELALMRLNPESPALENLVRIEKSAARAADLARQMLAYSGKGKFVVEAIDLNRLVEEMDHMLEVSISKKAILRYNLTRPLPAVNVDATQIRQIIMNLVINASEAIGDQSGVIAITTGCLECNAAYLQEFWLTDPIPEGLYVSLEIADSGCGMDKETLGRIFDPFFTTKFTGRGLGMAAVLGIVRGHKGAIKVYSEPGKGSSFKVLLPAGEKPAELFNGKTAADSWQGSGTALLVDDEETVRAIGSEMLKELGFDVITARDGREAVEIFKTGKEISVVILDLTMPHMDGEQCFRELRQLDPAVKVIMSSGFSEHEVTQKFAGKGLAGFVQKPYKLSVLKEAIKNVPHKTSPLQAGECFK